MPDNIERVTEHPVGSVGLRVVRDWVKGLVANDVKVIETDSVPESPVDDTLYVVVDGDDATFMLCTDGVLREVGAGVETYGELAGKPEVDGNEVVAGDQAHESLGLVGTDDFVTTPTGKTSGLEIVLAAGTPDSPTVITEIDDSAAMQYSTVHTSSNHYINNQLDAINAALAGKLNLLFVNELPDPPTANTQYYVATESDGVYDIWIVDSVGTMRSAGTTEMDLGGLVRDTRSVAGHDLSANITAAQMEAALKDEPATLTHKTIDADDNTISDLTTSNLKSGVLSTAVSSGSTNTQLSTAKAVYDYAVPKTSGTSKIYGTNGSGAANNYSLATSISSSSTDTQLPTAKAVYSYAVPKTTDANKVYGSSNNFDRSTSVSSSSTDTQLPTAKAVYGFAVAKTTNTNRVYGTDGSGNALQYTATGTFNSTASNQLLTRAGAYNLYNGVVSGNYDTVFCGNFMRTTEQSVSANTSTAISCTGSDVYRSSLVQLNSNGCKILVAGTYLFQVVARLSDTSGATRHWYLGAGTSMTDDENGGSWLYTYERHKGEGSNLLYCTAGLIIKPQVYIATNSGTLKYAKMRVFKLNDKL